MGLLLLPHSHQAGPTGAFGGLSSVPKKKARGRDWIGTFRDQSLKDLEREQMMDDGTAAMSWLQIASGSMQPRKNRVIFQACSRAVSQDTTYYAEVMSLPENFRPGNPG